ncbi:zinc ribbon domain-containing protein [Aminipila sp.]|uniref:zinc ribbon domain-containing protein n=1 Tax=Aminipila sp. TaxID=2060095 RepID=UPI0028984243|nr:zinc ribbon domain-containing protein [Aminipila sp.]
MRCVHCGKEVRNNIIFCTHCGRPVKLEYSHYACEFYESLSVWDKFISIFSRFSTYLPKYKQDVTLTRTTRINKSLKDTIKKKGSTLKELYDNYTQEGSGQTKENTISENINTSDTYTNQDPEYLGLKDIKKVKDSAEKVFRQFSNSSKEEKTSIIKIAGLIITIVLALITTFVNTSSHDDYSYVETNEAYEETADYSFPETPIVYSSLVENIDSCPLGSESLITSYLRMLYDDTYQMQWYDESLYSLKDFQPYISQIEQIETDYDNNENYFIYDQLITIKNLWQELIQPIYENRDQFDQEQIEDNLYQFSSELDKVCNYYLKDDF